jgi:hypothetical protein
MYPNQNQYSIDYLNEIAPQPQKKGLSNKLFLLIVGGGLLAAIIIGIAIFSSAGAGPQTQMETLAARLVTLQKIATKAQQNIKSNQLGGTNSSLVIFLANANHDIAAPLLTNGVDIKNLDKNIIAAESGTALSSQLENARLNAVFDVTYAREMGYQIDTVISLMKEINNKTNSRSLKAFLAKTDSNLEPIKTQMYNFNPAND